MTSLSLLAQVIEQLAIAKVVVDRGGRIALANALAARMFDYPREGLIGQPIESLVPERLRGAHPGFRAGYFAAPTSRPMGAGRDLYARRRDGSEFPVEIGLNPIETDQGTMVISAIIDLTERKRQTAAIEAALREKDLLLGEIHHRVKNNLQVIHSLLDLQAMRIQDAAAREMLRESQNRVRSMSLIHQTLYQSKDFGEVDFQLFLSSLLPMLVESYAVGAERVALHVDAHEVRLPISSAIPCGLVVNELVANALRHAFPDGRSGNVWVDLDESDGRIELSVANDGVPLPEGIDLGRTPTLGLQLVRLLAEQLGAQLAVQRSDRTRFSLRFAVSHGHE
jgi:PAS domain S-box-containing protein